MKKQITTTLAKLTILAGLILNHLAAFAVDKNGEHKEGVSLSGIKIRQLSPRSRKATLTLELLLKNINWFALAKNDSTIYRPSYHQRYSWQFVGGGK